MAESIAMVKDGMVYGVFLIENGVIKRAWLDPEAAEGVYEMMTYRNNDKQKVMKQIQNVVDVGHFLEVDASSVQVRTLMGMN